MTVLQHQAEVERLEKELRYAHFRRIQYDNPQSLESSAYHLDLVNNFLRVNEHSVNIAQTVLGII
jgi:phosphate:Na+ symporter